MANTCFMYFIVTYANLVAPDTSNISHEYIFAGLQNTPLPKLIRILIFLNFGILFNPSTFLKL